MKSKKLITALLCCSLACLTLSACGFADAGADALSAGQGEPFLSENEPESSSEASDDTPGDEAESLEDMEYTHDFFAMDTYMTLTAYGENAREAVEAGEAEINRLDALLSTGDEDSEIYSLNASGGGELSDETEYLIRRALEIYESTGGIYDITIYPVMDLWGFTGSHDFAVPDQNALNDALKLVDASKLKLTEEGRTAYLSMPDGVQIDLGGIVKGYADDRLTEIFKSYGIENAIINLGGDVHVIGCRPDGAPWRVGIQDPEDTDGYLGGLSLTDLSVVTSGGYERYFDDEETGIRYHHIIDPRDGYSAYNGLISVSVISEDGTLADALSTSLFIMGTEDAAAYCREHCGEDGFGALMEADDGQIYLTDNLQDSFIDLNGDTELNIISTD